MRWRALVPFVAAAACASSAGRPGEVTIVSTLQKPAPLLLSPNAAEDARIKELLDEAARAIDQGDTDRASAAALSVVCGRRAASTHSEELSACPLPRSADVSSGWALVGELAFEGTLAITPVSSAGDKNVGNTRPDQLSIAELAYGRAMRVTPSRMSRAIVLYKLGWVRYRLERFDAALGAFLETLEATRARDTGGGRDQVDVRDEAIEYAAISIAETDWDGDGQDDAVRGFARPEVQARLKEERPELPELYARVVSVLVDQAECADAKAALTATTARYPHHTKLFELMQSVAQNCP